MSSERSSDVDGARDSIEGALVWLCAATVIWLTAVVVAVVAGMGFLVAVVGIFGFLYLVPEYVSILSQWGSRPRRHNSSGYLRAAIDYRGKGVWTVYANVGQLALVLFFAISG